MRTNTTIHTLRHGHTSYNAEKRYAGTIDIPLSEQGMADCQLAAAALGKHPFDIVVTSTMQRAFQTGKLMLDGSVPIVQSKLCNERNFGIMEGQTWEQIQKIEPPILMISVGGDLHTVNPPGGEPFEDVWQRAVRFKRFLFRQYAGKQILVISHGVFLQMFNGLLRGKSCLESLADYPSNLELASFRFEDRLLTHESREKLISPADEVKF